MGELGEMETKHGETYDVGTYVGMLKHNINTIVDNSGEAPLMDKKSAEATLQEFSAFAVKDNWLDEDLISLMAEDDLLDGFNNDAQSLDEQLEDWETEDDSASSAWNSGDEPWDYFGKEKEEEEEQDSEALKITPGGF